MAQKINWTSEKRKISGLKFFEGNPRKASEKEAIDLDNSLNKFSLADPIIINLDGEVIGGNFRLSRLKEKGLEEVDVRVPDRQLDRKEAEELNLRLNKNTGSWDNDLLANFGKDMLEDVGWSSEELDNIFQLKLVEDDFDAEAEYAKITEPVTKTGDLYQLGVHRLLCGDSTSEDDFKKLFGDKKARMIFTDPPYNVDYKCPGGLDYASTKFGGTGGKILNDNKTDEECLDFYTKVLKNLYNFSTDDCSIYWWFANKNNYINRQAFKFSEWHMSQIIIWLKNSMVFSRGQDYHRQYEPCMFGWKRKKSHYKNKKINDFKDVFNLDFNDYNEMLDVWYEKRDITSKYVHPTQKPVRLAERGLKKNSQNYDIVADVFGGSGSTMIGCEQLHRTCYMAEMDPKYVDVIVKRWEQFTGDKAKLI